VTVTVSEATKLAVINWPMVTDRTTVIRNGIKPEVGYSRTNARAILAKMHTGIKSAMSKKVPTVWIGTIAELHHVKGYDLALRAMHELIQSPRVKNLNKRIMYVIIGDGEERAKLEKLSMDLGIQDNVCFMGHVDKASEYLKAFDFFLLPSRSEALGYVLIEAGIAGLSVVATSVGGIPEIVSDMKSGILVQPEKSRDIYHALEFLITHPGVARENAKALHTGVIRDFSFEEMIERTTRLYQKNTI
jgi:glycosyltransferase involved in cell wall biosynthesis